MKENAKKDHPKIQLIGCAKNEAAYLPEWIFHHLNIGFSYITIYVNNTDDNTLEILDKISNKHPNITYIIADELIASPPEHYREKTNTNFYNTNTIQAIIYTHALESRDENSDHIAFLDIDEFFFPYKPLSSIWPYDEKENSVVKRFNWILLSGDKKDFCPIAECAKGYLDREFKSVVPNHNVNIRAEDPHRFSINGNIGLISKDAVILHRVLRSPKEYLFLLARSTSNSKNKLANGFKRNRRGWTSRGLDLNKFNIHFEIDYEEALVEFTRNCDITKEIKSARDKVIKNYQTVLNTLNIINQQNIELTRSLGGLDIKHINYTRTALSSIFWNIIRLTSPKSILSHIPIKEAFIHKIKKLFK